jgi:hypothetical protein
MTWPAFADIHLMRQREIFAGWAKAAALPAEKCGFTATVGKIEPLPTLRRKCIRVDFSLQYEVINAFNFNKLRKI